MWLQAILGFLSALPKLVDIGEKLIQSISELVEVKRLEIAQRKIEEATKKAQNEKDTSDLDKLFNGGKSRSLPPDTKA